MGYKRKARVLFLASTNQYAALAVACAGELAAGLLEVRAGRPAEADAKWLAWADLVVTLDEAASENCPPLPQHVQRKHYPLPVGGSMQETELAFRARILSIVGGMRLLERNSAER